MQFPAYLKTKVILRVTTSIADSHRPLCRNRIKSAMRAPLTVGLRSMLITRRCSHRLLAGDSPPLRCRLAPTAGSLKAPFRKGSCPVPRIWILIDSYSSHKSRNVNHFRRGFSFSAECLKSCQVTAQIRSKCNYSSSYRCLSSLKITQSRSTRSFLASVGIASNRQKTGIMENPMDPCSCCRYDLGEIYKSSAISS